MMMHAISSRCLLPSFLLATAAISLWAAPPEQPNIAVEGLLPLGADGKPLNLDFETGTLKDWTAEGEAFRDQPIRGEIDQNRQFGAGRHSEKQGDYWLGGYERFGDKPQGTLTSTPFKITQPFASFRVGGGRHQETRVELVRKDTGEVISKASGANEENMATTVVDLKPHLGQEIFIRVVDRHSGGWGHVNFDNFRLHSVKPVVKGAAPTPGPADVYEHAGLTPEAAAKAMTLPEGFSATLFAGEPDVMQPVAMALDDRGRLWIAEAYTYPKRAPEGQGRDRILIFEDVDGDGRFDKRKVFAEKLNLVSGLEVGFGGVWVGAAPYLLFIPDADGDDKPDGEPRILLDGWGSQDTHETLNTFIWGPDGWLYGCHGVFTHSRVGKPGTPDAERTPLNAAIWRYHPTRHEFDVFCHGTSNPWGVDFNDRGQAFLTACVIPHLYHVIQGARYERQGGQHFNPYTYDDIKTIADHRHYVGGNPHGGNNRSDQTGGGHAHAGAMIYLGGSWPAKYRDQIFMNNIHGQRINMDLLKPVGSGYAGSHGPDFLLSHDQWSQILNLRYGPDGQAYMIDWYDKNACHHNNEGGHDRSNGRVFKIIYQNAKPVTGLDLTKRTDAELAQLALDENDWYVRHARRILQERAAKRKIDATAIAALQKIAREQESETRRLRGLWALHVIGQLEAALTDAALADKSPYVRGWAIQLLGEQPGQLATEANLRRLVALAKDDPSPVVRLCLASAAQRMAPAKCWDLVAALTNHAEDASDHNLPLMYWYALEPLVNEDPSRGLQLADASKTASHLPLAARRVAALDTPAAIAALVDVLSRQTSPARQLTLLEGLNTAFRGRRRVTAPPNWAATYAKLSAAADARVRTPLQSLAVTFGDASAQDSARAVLADAKAIPAARREALGSLVKAKDAKLPVLLVDLLREAALRGDALRALAAYDDPRTPAAILAMYENLSQDERRDALATLCSRLAYAKPLLAAVEKQTVPTRDLSADLVRQLRNFNDADVNRRLGEVWGTVRETAADKVEQITKYRDLLGRASKEPADVAHGRALFAKTCQQCHTLFAVGGKVGPDLTGSNRANLDYLLSNVVDPSAVMAKEYTPSVIITQDGRLITGIVKLQDKNSLTVQTPTEIVIVPRSEVDEVRPGQKSMMPDDLLKPLNETEVRSLVGYLASPRQTPLLATADNVKWLFNGLDLAGWSGDQELWSVQGGELVGKSAGLKHNEFLTSDLLLGDFHLTVSVKLVDNAGNSGIQFRSEGLPGGEVRGYQADIGVGWWGKLYEELGRGLLWPRSGEAHVKPGQWNTYEIIAQGSHIRTLLNGNPCVDLDDPKGARRGVLALQLHSGGPTEARFKDWNLELLPPAK